MDFLFGKQPTLKETQRENDRNLRKVDRDIERERMQLEREEKKVELEIKKAAKQGDKAGATILAKQLIQIRKQKTRTYAAQGKVNSIGIQNKTMGSNIKMAEAMKNTADTMKNMNTIMKPEQIAANAREFQQGIAKMNMTDEMINDALDDMLEGSDDEEESTKIIDQVLDEIGIEISGKMANAPAARGSIGESSKSSSNARVPTDAEIEAQLSRLLGS
ncbi:hypothetical protein WDU94_011319 [Cyamophila willieti]